MYKVTLEILLIILKEVIESKKIYVNCYKDIYYNTLINGSIYPYITDTGIIIQYNILNEQVRFEIDKIDASDKEVDINKKRVIATLQTLTRMQIIERITVDFIRLAGFGNTEWINLSDYLCEAGEIANHIVEAKKTNPTTHLLYSPVTASILRANPWLITILLMEVIYTLKPTIALVETDIITKTIETN